jgi:3-oxoadipate enol-lactonase
MTHEMYGGTVAVASGRDGPPVLLIHGMGLNLHMWQWQLPALEARFHVIRYDMLGHGDSDKTVKTYVMDDLVDQAVRLMDALGLDRCALAGFSLGGMIGQAFAIAHPDRISALAILNSAHDRDEAQRQGMMERLNTAIEAGLDATTDAALTRWFTPEFAARNPETIDQVRQWMNANDREVYPLIYRILAEGDRPLAKTIAAIGCPTLALACEEDHGNSPEMARRMAALIPNARAAIVPGLRHMGLVENPKAIGGILVPFLEEALQS